MITDSQYKELQKKVDELEKKMNLLSMQLSRLLLKGDVSSMTGSSPKMSVKKDVTKYEFEGQIYCKRRIAYVCVARYVKDHNINTLDELIKIFPDYLQGSLGVIKSADIAEKYANANKRFYFADEDIIFLSGKPYVVCSQWEKKNIERILSVARELGYDINPINYT